jgi:hypothetical protein
MSANTLGNPSTFKQAMDNRGNPVSEVAISLSELNAASQDIATGVASVQSAAFQAQTRLIRVCCTVACRILTGANPTALATSMLLPANWIAYIAVNSGDKLAAIQEGAAGKLNITECP